MPFISLSTEMGTRHVRGETPVSTWQFARMAGSVPGPSYCTEYSTTPSDTSLRPIPMPMKGMPTAKNVTITHVGVRMGCHARRRCW